MLLSNNKRKNYDSEFCGSIPVNFINSVQEHGVLVVLDKVNLNVVQVSENSETLLGVEAKDMLNKPISEFVGEEQKNNLVKNFESWPFKERIPYQLTFTGSKEINCYAIIHILEKYIIFELQEVRPEEEQISFLSLFSKIKYIMLSLKDAKDLSEVAEIAVTELKKLSEFDKVMLYKFDEEWNGTVLAEAKEEDMVSYLDLRFPASDIPQKARSLYHTNPYRLIPDVDFTPARLTPVVNPLTFSFTDMSTCNLRSVPKVHIEYLSNMGIKASMSIPIIVNNKLWGLLSCHHKVPKHLSFEILSAFELLSNSISAQVAAKEREVKLQYQTKINRLEIEIIEDMYSNQDGFKSFENSQDKLLEMLEAGGLALVAKNKIITKGQTPDEDKIKELTNWLNRYHYNDKIFVTNALPATYESGIDFKLMGAGLLALKLSKSGGNYFLAFRPEVVQTVNWGGNPNDAINFESDGKTYHPRNSFQIWKETVKDISNEWQIEEVEAFEKVGIVMSEVVLGL